MNTLITMKMLKGFSFSIIATIALVFAIDFESIAKVNETDSTIISIDKRTKRFLISKITEPSKRIFKTYSKKAE